MRKESYNMLQKLGWNKILWLITATLSFVTALIGVINPDIYKKVVSADLLPGTFSQDVMTIIASIVLFLLIIFTREEGAKKQIIILGLLGYLLYAYGIFVIEQVYTVLYLVYMAIFGLSFWSLVYAVANIRRDILQSVTLSNHIRYLSAAGSLLQPLVFYPLWISALLPLIQTGQKSASIFSVYILDLCFIMPAFIILAVMTLKKQGLGYILTPAMFVLGFTLIFSLVIGELVKPRYQLTPDPTALTMSLLLSLLFLVLAALHLWNLTISVRVYIPHISI
jgi:hypothetical protein